MMCAREFLGEASWGVISCVRFMAVNLKLTKPMRPITNLLVLAVMLRAL